MTATPCGSCKAPIGDSAYLCTGCTGKLAELLKLAADIAPDLDDAVAKLLRRGGGRRASQQVPLPYDLAASQAVSELRFTLTVWVRVVAKSNPSPQMVLPGELTVVMARWLHVRIGLLRQHHHAAEALAEIRDAVHRALAVIDRQPERVSAGLCDNCGRQLLAELGADSVTCACGMTALALTEKRRERAEAADVLGTPAELSAVMASLGVHVAPSTISGWGTHGRIERRAGGMYRLSDALFMASKM